MRSTLHAAAIGTLLAGAAALVACGPKRNPALEQARADYATAAADPQLTADAPVALHEAEQSLRRAERAFKDGEGTEASHLAYVAQRRVDIARAEARERQAEEATRAAHGSRSEVLLGAREAEISALRSRETDRGTVVTIPDVLFEFNRADLKPGAMRELSQLVDTLRASPDRPVVVEGHTDAVGSDAYNRDLSQQRAEAVAAFLERSGIPRSRLTTRGLGEGYPLATNDTEAGRQENRRVEVVIPHTGTVPRSSTSGVGGGEMRPGSVDVTPPR
jgi:OmpA-OmpF porin, OOP family